MGKKFLAVFLILISILSFSSCSMDSLTDFMGKMGVNIVPYDDTKAKKAAEETNLSSSDVDKNATVTEGKVSIGGVEIPLEKGFALEEGGMLNPLEDSERKEVVNTLYNAVVTLNPKDKETVVAEKAKPAPVDVQTATKNTAAVLESALKVIKNKISEEAGGGEETNKIEEVMGSLASSLNTIASNKTVSQGEALAVQLMQSFVATASKAYTGESVTNDDYINLANEAYNIAVIASAITPTLNIGLEDLIGAVVSGMGSSSSSEEEVTYSSRSLMLLSAKGEIPNHTSGGDRPSAADFENIGIPEESALVLRNYYKAISPFLNDPDYMNTIAVYKASFDNYMVFAEKAGEAYMASDEFKSIAEPSIFFNYALTSALYELENQYKLIRKEAEPSGQLDDYIELKGTVQVDGAKYDYEFPETIVDLINDFAASNSWVKDDSKLKIVKIKIGDSWEYDISGNVINHEEIYEDLVKINMPDNIKGIVFAFAYDSDFSGDAGEGNTKTVIDVINGIVVDNNASLLAALNSAEIALTHGDLLSSIIDLVTQMAGEDTGDVETPTDTEIEKALDEARAFLKSRRWVEDYFNGGETV